MIGLELTSKIRSVLRADAQLASYLATTPGVGGPAVYLNHISTIPRVEYPAVSIHTSLTTNMPMLFSQSARLQVDVWVPDALRDGAPPGAYGLSHAYKIATRIRQLLHVAHSSGRLSDSAYVLSWLQETAGPSEIFEVDEHIYHLPLVYRAVVRSADAVRRYPLSGPAEVQP